MSDYPNTGTTLDSKTRTGLSTQIAITVNGNPVGAVQSFAESQSRGMKEIGEVGTDGFIEIVPQSQTKIKLTLKRIVFDGLSMTEAFSRGFRNIAAQRIPFDIVVIDKFGSSSDSDWVVTTYHNCWFTSLDKTYDSSSYVITEGGSVMAEYMSTVRNEKATAYSSTDGFREIPADMDNAGIEQASDAGDHSRRGSMDFNGIFQAAFE